MSLTPGVFRGGLWKFTRHPNYLCEFLMWFACALYAVPSVRDWTDLLGLVLMLCAVYYFLVHMTGVWITEQSSVRRRGAEYKKYQNEVPAFLPWFGRRKTG